MFVRARARSAANNQTGKTSKGELRGADFPNSHRREATGCPPGEDAEDPIPPMLRALVDLALRARALYHRAARHLPRDRRRSSGESHRRGLRVQFAMDGE